MRGHNPATLELVWGSALSLAELGQKDVADTILLLLDRNELSKMKCSIARRTRRTRFIGPAQRTGADRILINTMIGAAKLDVPSVREKLNWLKDNDPSMRVRAGPRKSWASEPLMQWVGLLLQSGNSLLP
jgi:hypothetical protein